MIPQSTRSQLSRHPLRRSLERTGMTQEGQKESDLKLFVVSFTAFFVCFYTFLL